MSRDIFIYCQKISKLTLGYYDSVFTTICTLLNDHQMTTRYKQETFYQKELILKNAGEVFAQRYTHNDNFKINMTKYFPSNNGLSMDKIHD